VNERGGPERPPQAPVSSPNATASIVTDAADPEVVRMAGELLGRWVAGHLDHLDALVDVAQERLAALPEPGRLQRELQVLREQVALLLIRVAILEGQGGR
jgi:hypothetical protein